MQKVSSCDTSRLINKTGMKVVYIRLHILNVNDTRR